MLASSTKSCSVTINAVEQKIYFVTHPLLFSRAQATRVVSFEEIEQVYLNFWEDSYTIKDSIAVVSMSETPCQCAAQQCLQPTWGTRRVFRHFSWLEVGSGKVAFSRPAHLPLTRAVLRLKVDNLY